jgi:DNA-binding response OmpR family regulator
VTDPTDIIVVDDNRDISVMLKSVLEFSGYTVATCPGREQLLVLLQVYNPQLILMDMMLGDTDGRDICRELKGHTHTVDIPILMISAHPDACESCKAAGANAFLEKPFEMDELLDMTRLLLTKTASC